ncbi:LuxR C-terminal-related transcriptional regulator [Polymorphospora sp. NPDC051019]|uniref:helix-turn-helix transcriptional regulator n=1 Tax=Polymorphospora sp. NPDC051019 TaxID=3155725 RepID=UPI0034339FE3
MREDREVTGDLPLLASKLAVPPAPAVSVRRTRLLGLLDSGAAGPVTIVTGPAGWGKTTLLAAWARERPDGPPGWLSVDAGDGADRFWAYVRAALDTTVGPDGPAGSDGPLRLADALARRPEPVTLVVDDFHLLDDADVLAGVDLLLRHAGLRLVVGTRREPALPLHRFRLADELTEIRAADLTFGPDEAAELLAGHGVALPAGLVDDLHDRTEGWPAGLRLAADALKGHPEPAGLVDGFTGDHPVIAGYLAEEVLAGLPADLRDVLRRGCVADRLTGELVETLTGRPDGERLLGELERHTGLVRAAGGRPPAWRCHRMLGELLRAELHRHDPGAAADLHRRAAAWHAGQARPAEALRHALAARDWAGATGVLAGHWPELLPYVPAGPATDPAPPPPDDAVRSGPELALAYALDRLGDDPATAGSWLRLGDELARRLTGGRRDRFVVLAAAVHLVFAQLGGDDGAVRSAASRLLALVEPNGDGRERAAAQAALGAARLTAGDLDGAQAVLVDGLADAEAAGPDRAVLSCGSRLALIRALRGELDAAQRIARQVLALPRCQDPVRPPDCAYAHLALAVVAAERGRPDEAEAEITAAGRAEEPQLAALVDVVTAELRHDRGDLTGGYQALRAGRAVLSGRPTARFVALWFAVAEAELRTAHGDVDTARTVLRPLVDRFRPGRGPNGSAPADGATALPAPVAVALSRTHLRGGDPRTAARLLPTWEDGRPGDRLAVRLDAGLLDALTASRLGDRRRATRALERVLALAEPEGFRRVFVRYGPPLRDLLAAHLDSGTAYWPLVNELIDATGTAAGPVPGAPPPAPPSGEELTERELTVLRYLQSILSNVEIAAEMSLSVNTVKTHVRNIYRKLDATRRREAVRRARELRLL